MSKLKRAIEILRCEGLARFITKSILYGYRRVIEWKFPNGIDVVEEDWDNLIILDACRFDDFEELNDISGRLESRISQGTQSPEFLKSNFNGKVLHDTVYVTANPHYYKIDDDVFHQIVADPLSEWDPELQCVKPSDVTMAARKAHSRFPNKRLIIHYMQPHDPPIGPTGDEIRERLKLAGPALSQEESKGVRIMEAVAENQIPVDEAREAYCETLEIVLDEVKDLLGELDGESVITADHGEMFGEVPYPFLGSRYEHGGLPTKELCKVPWHVVENGSERRSVQSDPPVLDRTVDDEKMTEQLEALGYA